MTYRDYVWLIKPDRVGSDYGGGVVGCPREYGLEDLAECESRTDFSIHTDCWSQEIQGRVIAEALEDGYHGFTFKKGELFEVTRVSEDTEDVIIRRLSGDRGEWYAFGVRDKFKFYIEKEESNMKYEVGDKVRVRSWESMEKEFGQDKDGDINISPCFTKEMKKYCGKIVTIHRTKGAICYVREDSGRYAWCEDMFGYAESFSKDDLEPGMVVEYRNGDRRLYVNNCFAGPCSFGELTAYNSDLTNRYESDRDVVKIYYGGSKVLEDMTKYPGGLIWEREKPVKEISSEEAFKILEEKLGCPVKIKKD